MTEREGNLVKRKMKFILLKYMYVLDTCSSFEGKEYLKGMVMDN